MSRFAKISADAVVSVCAHYDASGLPVVNADGRPETPEQQRKRTHPWRNFHGEPLSYDATERKEQVVPHHANPVGRARSAKRGRK